MHAECWVHKKLEKNLSTKVSNFLDFLTYGYKSVARRIKKRKGETTSDKKRGGDG